MDSEKDYCCGQEKHLTNDDNPRPRKGAEEAIVGINHRDNQQCGKLHEEIDGLVSPPIASKACVGVLGIGHRLRAMCTPAYRKVRGC